MDVPAELVALYNDTAQSYIDYYLTYAETHRDDQDALASELGCILAAVQMADVRGMDPRLIDGVLAIYPYLDTSGRYFEALTHLERAKHAAERQAEQPKLAEILGNLAHMHLQLGHYDHAEADYRRALETIDATHSPELYCGLLLGLGVAYDHRGQFDQAETLYRQALVVAQKGGYHKKAAKLLLKSWWSRIRHRRLRRS